MQESIHDEVIDRLKTRLSTLRLGDPLDKNTDIGAINSAEQLARIRELSRIGEDEGAERWTADCVIPEKASGSRRRSSPASRRRTGSPARRCSARSCPC